MESLIRRVLREAVEDQENPYNSKEDGPETSQYDDKSEVSSKYEKVKDLLGNNIFNHAGVIERLWGESDATNRSLFRKKLEQELNDNGTPYSFDDKEVSRIISILMDTSKQINKKFGKKKG